MRRHKWRSWEIQNVLDFVRYESDNGRSSNIKAEESIIRSHFHYYERLFARRVSANGKENLMDLKKVWAERLRQYQLLIAFAAKQKQAAAQKE